MSPSEPPSKRILLVWRDDPGLTVPTVVPTVAALKFPTSTPTVVPTVAELLHKLEAVPYIKTNLDSAESPFTAVPAVSKPPNVFKSVPYIKVEDDDEDLSTTVAKPPNSPKIVPYKKIEGAGSPRTAVPTIAALPISPEAVPYTFTTGNDAENQDSRTSIWSMYGEYFDVPNDPREMFLFFRGLFDDVYKTAAAGAFLSIRQLALLHGAPSILGPPNKRKASTIVQQESRVQPPIEDSPLRLAGRPSLRRPAEPWPAPQFPRPLFYRQPAELSSANQAAGPSSAHQPDGPPPSPTQPGPLSVPASPSEGCRGAKRTRPAPPPIRRLDRYQVIPPTRDLGDFASVEDACLILRYQRRGVRLVKSTIGRAIC
ncbi:hypothetical protein P167DRAFT_550056 [Morchella conica CCBAS932]|uniref:Uncharacterized protein n=1 Tax=Morchella conica CCBAS932 TaxID=1392247 RepID=A0A3N4K962_9PEZI|nr:hypothetical protein P167DRAFT_550056 [Morchella conica CCBAS932]